MLMCFMDDSTFLNLSLKPLLFRGFFEIFFFTWFTVHSSQVLRGKHQENISSILSTLSTSSISCYKACQVCHFLKRAKYTILWSMPITPFYEARQAHNHAKFIELASTPSTQACKHIKDPKHASMEARHLADSCIYVV